MRKVLIYSTLNSSPWAGSEELWYKMAISLLSSKISVSVYVKQWSCRHTKIVELERLGAKIIERANETTLVSLKNRVLQVDREIKWLKRIKKENPDLVVLSQGSYQDGYRIGWQLKNAGIRYAIITQAAADTWWAADEKIKNLREIFIGASKTYFVSEANRQTIEFQMGTILANAEIVFNPFNVKHNETIEYPAVEDEWYKLACVGRLNANAKGQDIIIKVLSSEKWKNRPLKVLFYGAGPNRSVYEDLIKLHKIDNIEICGFANNICEVWKRCHGLLLASRHEGMALAVIEAMLCGRVVITTDVAGNREIIKDNISGYLAKAATPELVDEALERAWAHRGQWKDMGLAAAKAARNKIPQNPGQSMAEKILNIGI